MLVHVSLSDSKIAKNRYVEWDTVLGKVTELLAMWRVKISAYEEEHRVPSRSTLGALAEFLIVSSNVCVNLRPGRREGGGQWCPFTCAVPSLQIAAADESRDRHLRDH